MNTNLLNILKQSVFAFKRDWRSGELRLIGIAVIIAVTSLTSVGFFTQRIQQATELQATELLAADLVLRSTEPIERDIIHEAHASSLITTLTTSFRSVVVAEDNLHIAEVKAVEKGYPIRGKLRASDTLFGQEYITDDLPLPGTVWVDARLLQGLSIDIGDQINLGASQFKVDKVLVYEPDRGGDLFNIAPRLLLNRHDLPGTNLILPGSRVRYRLLLGGNADAVLHFRQYIENKNRNDLKIQGVRDARPELKIALERAEQFLGLAALVSIALAGLAIAMSAQRYAIRHYDNCAIMRCLGAEQHTILKIYLIQLLILSFIASLLGTFIGYFAQEGLSTFVSGLTQQALPSPSLTPAVTGITTGIITVLGFALPQILRLGAVSPMRVLRRDLTPMPLKSVTTYAIAILALALLTPWQSGRLYLTLYTFLGILLTALALTVSAKFIIARLNRLRSKVGIAFRYGLANIARRANNSTAQILGIGLGVMIILLLTLVRTDLLENWRNRLPEGTPNYFLINIQENEVEALESFLQKQSVITSDVYPMIRGRLVAINGNNVEPEDYSDMRARRLLAREFNLSWSQHMQSDNRLLAGEWWPEDTDEALFSVEEGVAETLGFKLNDTLTFSIGSQKVTAKVSNVRWVEWDSFNVNFFVVANPGTLDDYPGTFITSFYLQPDKKSLLINLVKAFPSITVIDVDALLVQIRSIMEQVIKTVEFVFGFTLLAGLLVMLAALQTTHDQRSYESALLSALGANRNQILSSLIAEFVCIGLVAGILSAFAASAVELILAEFVFKMNITINPWIWLIAPLICVMLIVLGGIAGTRRILYIPPIVALRKV